MNPEPPPPPRHYAWPKYVLASLALFLFVCVTWTIREVNRVKRYRRETLPQSVPFTTNDRPALPPPGKIR